MPVIVSIIRLDEPCRNPRGDPTTGGKKWREKIPAILFGAEFAPFSGCRGKELFPARRVEKGGNSSQLAGTKIGTILDFSTVACSKSSRFLAYYQQTSNAQNTWDFCWSKNESISANSVSSFFWRVINMSNSVRFSWRETSWRENRSRNGRKLCYDIFPAKISHLQFPLFFLQLVDLRLKPLQHSRQLPLFSLLLLQRNAHLFFKT